MPKIDTNIHNIPPLQKNRRKLRNDPTPAEASLWKHLRRRQLLGKKFRRQDSVGRYIMDFYCSECMLGVELDGAAHYSILREGYDGERDRYLRSVGIEVLRFENKEVFQNLEGVLETIRKAVMDRACL